MRFRKAATPRVADSGAAITLHEECMYADMSVCQVCWASPMGETTTKKKRQIANNNNKAKSKKKKKKGEKICSLCFSDRPAALVRWQSVSRRVSNTQHQSFHSRSSMWLSEGGGRSDPKNPTWPFGLLLHVFAMELSQHHQTYNHQPKIMQNNLRMTSNHSTQNSGVTMAVSFLTAYFSNEFQ